MLEVLRQWYERNLTDPQIVILTMILIIGFTLTILLSEYLAPFMVSIVFAYLLEGLVAKLQRLKMPRVVAVSLVTTVSLALMLITLLVLVPLLSQQITDLIRELPNMFGRSQQLLLQLPQNYPDYVSEQQVQDIFALIRAEIASLGQKVVTLSLASVLGAITFLVYLILVPLMVFFLLKDRDQILDWFRGFLPEKRNLVAHVWAELNIKIAGYVRGKFLEVIIIWSASYVTFVFLDLNYAMLLGLLVGLSVIIPYVGATVVTLPVALVAYYQWGAGSEFWTLIGAYAVIQFLDGNVLVPLLFSEMVNLHPLAIIIAVVFFGGIWGVWGVFFAIPLATLVHVVLKVWPTNGVTE